ncbi:SMP-LTD domain-containing protein [Haematococcus lacustris]|uniref:SMP-LTD domain-containing protein n=1 Tax=Haematococcus lacustris TaxID=44745 RepID=A0A699YS54_HAELA|nr:SMP-LTD domain-containing protein [Haematococcus lacustris]
MGPSNASEGGPLWPHLALDLVYSGSFSMTVDTKLELQKGGLFESLNAAFERLKGGGGSVTASTDSEQGPSAQPGVVPVTLMRSASSTSLFTGSRKDDSCSEASLAGSAPRCSAGGVDDHTAGHSGSSGGSAAGGLLGRLRRAAASTAQSLAANIAENLAKVPVQLVIELTQFEGTLLLWLPPPPSDR